MTRKALALFEHDLSSRSRTLAEGVYPFAHAFPLVASSDRVGKIFGSAFARRFRSEVSVEIADRKTRYMRVSERDGHLVIDRNYLLRGDPRFLFLDLVHEMTHIRQFFGGLDLYDDYLEYVDRPVELEAFALSLLEARQLQMPGEVIQDYLKLDWVTEVQYGRLLEHLGVVSETVPTPCLQNQNSISSQREPGNDG